MSTLSRAVRLPARQGVGLIVRSKRAKALHNTALYTRHFSQVTAAPLRRPTWKTIEQAMQLQRNMHVRALSFSSLPKMVLRSFRIPTYIFTAAGGAFAYANYKVDGEKEIEMVLSFLASNLSTFLCRVSWVSRRCTI